MPTQSPAIQLCPSSAEAWLDTRIGSDSLPEANHEYKRDISGVQAEYKRTTTDRLQANWPVPGLRHTSGANPCRGPLTCSNTAPLPWLRRPRPAIAPTRL